MFKYTNERNVQIVISILKANNIRKIVVSPGATNVSFVASIQNDDFFEMYSVVDERSAAYVACGLAAESCEIVALSCTGATSSRNYMPGLTEAYYRKLPILAITSSMDINKVGHLFAQATDRSNPPSDTVRDSFYIPFIKDEEDEWHAQIQMNKAISLLHLNGGGPVHINVATKQSSDFSVTQISPVKIIKVVEHIDELPNIVTGKIAIFVGSHYIFSEALTNTIDKFCSIYDAVVFCDHTSGYKGKYKVLSPLMAAQEKGNLDLFNVDLLIHIGEISGDYYTLNAIKANEVWRVSEDGEIRDKFKKLTLVAKVKELDFFNFYTKNIIDKPFCHTFLDRCLERDNFLRSKIANLPFSNIWVANELHCKLPKNSCIHLGILQSLRSWNFFKLDDSIDSFCNVGGFGIDGNFSTLVGASLVNPNRLYYGVVGDLSFFYDINIIGNRNIGRNIRLLVINNGKGGEFKMYHHIGDKLGKETDNYIAAAGHNGSQSRSLLKHIAIDLGFSYLSASNMEEFKRSMNQFINPNIEEKSIVFEVFTDTKDERISLVVMRNLINDLPIDLKEHIKNILPDSVINIAKKIIK